MRFAVLMKATPESEAGVMPSQQLLTEMGRFNEELAAAGVMLAGEGFHPSSRGARIRYASNAAPTVVNGPFTGDLVSGFWMWEVKSLAEAIDWARRIPNSDGVHREVEIRQVFSPEDFGEALTPEVKASEERIRAQVEGRS
jgi:hypothetical protein